MNRIALLSLAALLIFSVFGVAHAQLAQSATVTLDDGVKEVTIASDIDVNCTLNGANGLGLLEGQCNYDNDTADGHLYIYTASSTERTTFETDHEVESIEIDATNPQTWDNEYYRVQWTTGSSQ